MLLFRMGPLALGLAAGLAAGLSAGQMTSTVRPAAGGPAPVNPASVTVTPVPPAPATPATPAPPGLPSPMPYPGGTPSGVLAPPAGSPLPGTGLPSPGPVTPPMRGSAAGIEDDTRGAPMGAGAGSAVSPTAPGLPPTPQALAASFLTADANRDGTLTRAEAQQLTVMPPGLSFEDLDRDKDGRLSRSEYEGCLGR